MQNERLQQIDAEILEKELDLLNATAGSMEEMFLQEDIENLKHRRNLIAKQSA